jgi:tetratricopeptide (TPR) repeat protein
MRRGRRDQRAHPLPHYITHFPWFGSGHSFLFYFFPALLPRFYWFSDKLLVATFPDDAEINYQTAWVHDHVGREREAVPFYIRAIELGLSGQDLEGALPGLGSTYRTIGAYQQAEETFRRGPAAFPHHRAFQAFLAMALYNLHRYHEAMELLLTALAETSSDATILQYKRAILFYASQLDQVWDGQ